MFRKVFAITALLITIPVSVHAETCHELVMSYVLADQDKPSEAGDKFYMNEELDSNPILMETTGYYHGTHGSHGDRMREGYAACAPELYGDAVMVYEAVKQEDGTYRIGEYLNTFEIRDTGYGYSTGEGQSRVRADKTSAGTIESGIHLDIYRYTYQRCREWMKLTNGKVFAVIVPAKG